ncbi:hypothetical protein ISS03_05380 [Patescibacteria group bacterium]|nr:hypothetical protein [Patescibacteria group bacterium]
MRIYLNQYEISFLKAFLNAYKKELQATSKQKNGLNKEQYNNYISINRLLDKIHYHDPDPLNLF